MDTWIAVGLVPSEVQSRVPADVVGYRALGRQGELGVVVGIEAEDGRPSELVVRGGISAALTYYVPTAFVRTVSDDRRTIHLDADLSDFVPKLHEDGTVELRPLQA